MLNYIKSCPTQFNQKSNPNMLLQVSAKGDYFVKIKFNPIKLNLTLNQYPQMISNTSNEPKIKNPRH